MEKCYFSKKHEIGKTLCIITTPVLVVFFAGFGIFVLSPSLIGGANLSRTIMGAGILIFGLAFGMYETLYVIWLGRTYKLCDRGILIQYAKRKVVEFPWDSVSQICVCDAHHGGGGDCDHLIWCSIGRVKHCPPNIPWHLDSFEYEFIHAHSVITVEYSTERLETFKQYYNEEIPDFRNTTL